tara:strand:+ start:38487 stop:38657 length:171 start_codon:yes stop_codon:yes gene_type:complete
MAGSTAQARDIKAANHRCNGKLAAMAGAGSNIVVTKLEIAVAKRSVLAIVPPDPDR